MIKLENITFRYQDDAEPALKNINLEISTGEIVCIMGANGSGKSTFAKLIAGLVKVKQGQVKIRNNIAKPMQVGIIFQNPDNQMVAVTVEKELAFALENLGYSQERMEKIICETLHNFGITHLRKRLTAELSGGEKQRVALASVMIFQPDILVLDEPDSFLDVEGKADLKKELVRIKADKPSMIQIYITQYPETAHEYDRLIVFSQGEIKADNKPENILNDFNFCVNTGLAFSADERKRIALPAYLLNNDKQNKQHISKIEFEKVSFNYAAYGPVIKNLSYIFNRGEAVGVYGLSGSGKSTLGNLICNLLQPGDGKIRYIYQSGNELSSGTLSGKVSGVFQQPERQFFLPTCQEEVTFGPKNFGITLLKNDIYALFAMVGLEGDRFMRRDPFTLSVGEKRRLAFASVLSMAPDFIVFDEPTCGLDREGVGRFILLAKALKERGTGLVIISHDQRILKMLTDRVINLKKVQNTGNNLK